MAQEPQPGDHIYCQRKGFLYTHHGIYVGNGMVIHLRGKSKKVGPSSCQKCIDHGKTDGEIAKSCLDCFLCGKPVQIFDYSRDRVNGVSLKGSLKPVDKVIEKANELLENNNRFGSYNAFANNCEDFALYCKTGMAYSSQAMRVIKNAGRATGPLLIVVTPVLAVGYFTFKAFITGKRALA